MANYNYITSSGTVVPDTADVKEIVQNEYKEALGDDISLEDSTPQGRLIDIETTARTAVIENNALVANLFNVMLSYGIFLDAMLANFGMYREGATASRVEVILTGQKGTVIPAGSQASTSAGVIFYSENDLTIGEDGTVNGDFLSLDLGEIACAAGELNKIVDGTFGWETISNPASADLGTDKESDAHFKQRFLNSGLFTGKALLENYYKVILDTENVKSAFVYDNYADTQVEYDTVTILPHSVYCCVDGGNDEDIANAIFSVKSVGCGFTGTTSVQVKDDIFGVLYNVKFSRPELVKIYVSITVDKGTSASTELENTIKEAVQKFASGDISGYDGLNIGVNVSPFEMAAAVNTYIPGITVKNLQVGYSEDELSVEELTIHVCERAVIYSENIKVVINE